MAKQNSQTPIKSREAESNEKPIETKNKNKEYFSIEVKGGNVTIDGRSVSTSVPDGKYDVKVWRNGEISFYTEGYLKEIQNN